MASVESVVTTPSLLGECPLWSPLEQVLYWVDIEGRLIHRYDPASGSNKARSLPSRPGSLALTETAGRLLVATEHQLAWFDWKSGTLVPYLDVAPPTPAAAAARDRLNDGRTDPAGRFVVGGLQADVSAPANQSVYQVGSQGGASTLMKAVTVTNGLAFDPVRGRMYFADTPTEKVMVFDYDHETGALGEGRVFVDYADLPGKPDGACVDAEGCYWSASVYGWAVTRFTPDGDVDRRIEVPVEKPSMPAFGGPDMSTLYITTIGAAGTVPSKPGRDGFVPGSLLTVDAGVAGVADVPFAGSAR